MGGTVIPPEVFLQTAAQAIQQRGAQRDRPNGERSMERAVGTFNALCGKNLTEREGWIFQVCLKLARAENGAFLADDYVDGAAYIALAGETASRDGGRRG